MFWVARYVHWFFHFISLFLFYFDFFARYLHIIHVSTFFSTNFRSQIWRNRLEILRLSKTSKRRIWSRFRTNTRRSKRNFCDFRLNRVFSSRYDSSENTSLDDNDETFRCFRTTIVADFFLSVKSTRRDDTSFVFDRVFSTIRFFSSSRRRETIWRLDSRCSSFSSMCRRVSNSICCWWRLKFRHLWRLSNIRRSNDQKCVVQFSTSKSFTFSLRLSTFSFDFSKSNSTRSFVTIWKNWSRRMWKEKNRRHFEYRSRRWSRWRFRQQIEQQIEFHELYELLVIDSTFKSNVDDVSSPKMNLKQKRENVMKSRKQTTRQRFRQWQRKNETKFAKTLVFFHQFNRSTIENFRIYLSNISSNRRREFCFSKKDSTKLKKSRWKLRWAEKSQQSCFWTSFFLNAISSMMKYEMFIWFVERKNRFYVCQTVQILWIESDKSFLFIVFCKSSRSCAIVCFRFHAFIARFIASWRCDFSVDRERNEHANQNKHLSRNLRRERTSRKRQLFFFAINCDEHARIDHCFHTSHVDMSNSSSFQSFTFVSFFSSWTIFC